MIILPAIDLIDKQAVRLLKGDYAKKTVYSNNPLEVAQKFEQCGAEYIHLVDLDGAKSGDTPNFEVVKSIKEGTNLFCEIGGGIRDAETIDKYLSVGIDRVILGTSALDLDFLNSVVSKYGDKIAVGVDLKDEYVAVKGWTEKSNKNMYDFFDDLTAIGVRNVICTDISKDGAMKGTNLQMYKELSDKYTMDITASGGVSTYDDIEKLKALNLYGAIIGKAYYSGAIDLTKAVQMVL